MDLKATASQVEKFLRSHSPEILTGFGVTGVVSTAYLAWKAGYKAANTCILYPEETSRKERIKNDIKHHWKQNVPMVLMGGGTVVCIVAATRIGTRRTAVLSAAYSLSQNALVEYKEKVKEQFGERKEQKVRDDIAADKVRANPIGKDVVLIGSGNVMCCELQTMRYFLCDVETLKKAQNEINDRILRCDYANLAEFYTLINQSPSPYSEEFGWFHDRGLMEVQISAVLMDDTTPCIGFDFNYLAHL